MKNLLTLLLGFICMHVSSAQDHQLKGKVINSINQIPIAGARVETGKQVTSTNNKGEFAINCTGTIEITIQHPGFEIYKQTNNCNQVVFISLIPAFKSMEEVEITTSSHPLRSQLEQAKSISRLSETELKRGNGLFLDDAINTNVPGVIMERRSQSGGQQINIRGYGNGMGFRGINSNFDMQGTRVYFNGIPITDAEGLTIMDDIDFGSLSSVEISKGPSGTIYGQAIAGVINLRSQKAEKGKTYIGQDLMVGSDGLLRSTSRIAIGSADASLLVSYGYQNFNGFMNHTASQKNFVNIVGDANLSNRQKINYYLGYADSYDERNGELTKQQYASFDYSGNPAYIRNNAHSSVKTFRAGLSHNFVFTETFSNTTTFFGASQNMDNSSAGGWTDKLPLNYGFRSIFQNHFNLSKGIILSGITGIEMQKMNSQTLGYGMGADSNNLTGYNIITNVKSNQATSNFSKSIFTQWTFALPKGFNINAGVGLSSLHLKLEDRLWALHNNRPGNEKLRVFENKYRNMAAPSFSINKKIGEKISVYASYSTGYKAPVTGNILISATGQLNTGLKPEKGKQFEIGTKGQLLNRRLFYTLALYQARFINKFSTVAVPNSANTATLYTFIVNAGKMNNRGLEMLIQYNAVKTHQGFFNVLRPFVNLSLSDYKYDDYKFQRIGKNSQNKDSLIIDNYSGKQVAGFPPIIINMGIDADTRMGIYGNVNFNYRSAMIFTSDGLNKTNSYNLLNIKLGYRKTFKNFGLNLFAGANNITGNQYYQMVFVNQLPDAYIPASNKINFYGGASLNLQF